MIPSFTRYMETTRHLVLYRLDSNDIATTALCLSRVETLCLLHCSPRAINHFLCPTVFPSLRRIHYLSKAPQEVVLHRRFGTHTKWIFPLLQKRLQPYPFYDRMVEGGWGHYEPGLVDQYLIRHKPIGGEMWFDIHQPTGGMMEGKWYHTQQRSYLYKKQDLYHRIHQSPTPQEVHGCKGGRGEDVELSFQRVVLGLG